MTKPVHVANAAKQLPVGNVVSGQRAPGRALALSKDVYKRARSLLLPPLRHQIYTSIPGLLFIY
jgi:hypothetical protein